MLPGHPIYTFRAENRALERLLTGLHQVVDAYKLSPADVILDKTRMMIEMLFDYDKHFIRKENLLFPYLEKVGFYGPSKVMWGVHNEIRTDLKSFKDLLLSASSGNEMATPEKIESDYTTLETALREMIYKEEKILFPAALERLSEVNWKNIRSQEASIGYCYVEPGYLWPEQDAYPEELQLPAILEQPSLKLYGKTDLVPLNSGQLTGEQINLLLKNLPVDITFVDENDNVQYFSETQERIFQRSPAIIGRKVQNCHPPQSMNRVQHILDDFRAGQRDIAEFWIQMAGKFIHIRYFALRDEAGRYRGTIEVSQDLTDLRKLEGERRLLDEAIK
jgi:PAS domain S-box-containing protein